MVEEFQYILPIGSLSVNWIFNVNNDETIKNLNGVYANKAATSVMETNLMAEGEIGSTQGDVIVLRATVGVEIFHSPTTFYLTDGFKLGKLNFPLYSSNGIA